MTAVWHNTHLTPAVRIAQDRRITGGLIYDGKLRDTRTEVVYLTPKYWPDGNIYGSFCFEMEWAEIAKNRALYWVEENTSHSNTIARFLLSWNDVSKLPVTLYNPTDCDGPLRLHGGQWYWLGSIVPEIVLDEAIYTISVKQLTFDTHRDGYCHPTRGWSCRERGHGGSIDSQSSFVARLLADTSLGMEDLMIGNGEFTHGVRGGHTTLWARLFKGHAWGGPLSDDGAAADVISAACMAYHVGDRDKAKRLMSMIDTKDRADRVFREMIRTRFAFPTFDWE
jgi:hypothetical protein